MTRGAMSTNIQSIEAMWPMLVGRGKEIFDTEGLDAASFARMLEENIASEIVVFDQFALKIES